MVANEGLEKARAYLEWSPGANGIMSPLKDTKVTHRLNFWIRAECALKRKKSLLSVGPEPGTSRSVV